VAQGVAIVWGGTGLSANACAFWRYHIVSAGIRISYEMEHAAKGIGSNVVLCLGRQSWPKICHKARRNTRWREEESLSLFVA